MYALEPWLLDAVTYSCGDLLALPIMQRDLINFERLRTSEGYYNDSYLSLNYKLCMLKIWRIV